MKLMKVLAFLLSVIMLSVSLNVAAYDEVPTHICDDLDKCFFVEQNNLQDNQDIGIQATCTHGTIEVRKAGGYYTGSTPLYCNIWVQHYQVYCTTCGEIWATYDQYEPRNGAYLGLCRGIRALLHDLLVSRKSLVIIYGIYYYNS